MMMNFYLDSFLKTSYGVRHQRLIRSKVAGTKEVCEV